MVPKFAFLQCVGVEKTGTQHLPRPCSRRTRLFDQNDICRALRSDMRVVGEVEIIRAPSVKVDPTLHNPISVVGVDRDGEVV